MISDLRKHKIDYSVLAILAAAYLIYFIINKNNPNALFLATLVFSLSYILWGVFHHARDRSLRLKVVLEYVLVATLAVVIASSLLL